MIRRSLFFVVFLMIALVFNLSGGSETGSAGMASAQLVNRRAPVVSPQTSCDTLSRNQCAAARHCTLVPAGQPPAGEPYRAGRYRCRPVANACEAAVRQWDLPGMPGGSNQAAERCAQTSGCQYVAHDCYCSCAGYGQTAVEDEQGSNRCVCVCGGGTPPMCAPTAT